MIAHPLGILRGVDHLFTGRVERIDVELLQTCCRTGIVPVVPPLGMRRRRPHLPRELRRGGGRGRAGAAARSSSSTSRPPTASMVGGELARQLSVDELRGRAARRPRSPPPRPSQGAPRRRRLPGGRAARARDQRHAWTRGCWPRSSRTRASARSSTPTSTGRSAARASATCAASSSSSRRRSRARSCCRARRPRSSASSTTTTSSRSTATRSPASPCTSTREREQGRAGLPVRAPVAREPGHRPAHGAVRRGAGARDGPAHAVRALDAGLQLLPVEGAASPRARPTTCRPAGASATSRAAGARGC